MAGKTAILTLKILGDAKDAQKALDDTSSSAGKFESGVTKAALPAAAALAGLGAAGLSAARAAAEDAAAADQLALALRNSAGASDQSITNTEKWITQTSKAAAVADDELRPALATLVRATGDVGTSQDAMAVALDVSAATGKDVESVSTALAKAYGGQTGALKKMVPGMDDAILASGDMDAIMAELSRTMGGAAAEAAGSAEGQVKGMEIAMAETQETIGSALLPAMTLLAGLLTTVATWVQENTTLFLAIAAVVGTVAAAILALNVAFKAYTIISALMEANTKRAAAGQWALNVAMLSNPVLWVVIGILALVAAIVLIATKTTWFQDIWATVWGFITDVATAAWEGIQHGAQAALDWIVSAWESLQGAVKAVWDWILNAIETAWNAIVAMARAYIAMYVATWNLITAAVGAVWDWIVNAARNALTWVVNYVRDAVHGMTMIWEGIKSVFSNVWENLKDTATRTLDAILHPIDAIKRAFDRVVDSIKSVIDWIKNIKVPAAVQSAIDAIGGIMPGSVPPTSTGTATAAPTGRGIAPTLTANATSSGDGATIVIQGALDPVAVARQIRLILRNDERRRSGVVVA